MSPEITYAQWEALLNGSLAPDEQQKLEDALQRDPALQKQLEQFRAVRSAQRDPGLDHFRTAVQQAQAQYQQETPVKKMGLRWVAALAVAASIALLIWFNYQTKRNPQELYADYAMHAVNLQQMGTDTDRGTLQSLFQQKKYAAALPLIDCYLGEYPDAADVRLARGIALLETGQYEEAVTAFRTLAQAHPIYTNEAHWYQALTYLKQEQITAAITSLRNIPSGSSRYATAQELLRQLK
ncbi:MAG: tetratricopeptide repeat protein [Bacteroidota bacterium]